MRLLILCTLLLLAAAVQFGVPNRRVTYTPDWKSLDSRPNPAWYDKAKIGIFLHWGVFSVPSYTCFDGSAEGYWIWTQAPGSCMQKYHNDTYGANFKYAQFGPMFKAQLYDPDRWARLFKKSGAKYVVLTAKHGDGWCNYPSPQSWNWNSVDNGPGKDLVGMLTTAVRKAGLKMGFYHSQVEWYNPLFLADQKNNFTTTRYVDEIVIPQFKAIVNNYKPSVIWADGDGGAPDTYWKAKEYLAWLFNQSPVKDEVVINDRWGAGDTNHHGGFYTGGDRYNPDNTQTHKWEDAFTLDAGSWGFNRNATLKNYLTIDDILGRLVGGAAKNGNSLINLGPTMDGLILPIFEERLTEMGEWLDVNGEGIYETRPFRQANDTSNGIQVWYTEKKEAATVYATFMSWPEDWTVTLSFPVAMPGKKASVTLLGYKGAELAYKVNGKTITISLPVVPLTVLKSKNAWMLKLQNWS